MEKIQGITFNLEVMLPLTVLAIRKAGHLNINLKTKLFDNDFDARLLANTLKEPANQNVSLKIKHFCFYIKVACLSYGEYLYRL